MYSLLNRIIFISISTLITFSSSFALEQDLFESIGLTIPDSLPDEVTSVNRPNSNEADLLPFDEELLLEEYSNIDPWRERIIYEDASKNKIYVPTNARRMLVGTNSVITELAVLGFPDIWSNGNGLSRKGKDLLKFIKNSYIHGLIPSDYSGKAIRSNLSADEIEIIASKAFIDLTNDILLGRLDPKKADYDWHIKQYDRIAVNEILAQALYSSDIIALLSNKLPQTSIYVNLSKKLQKFRNTKNGWGSFPATGPKLKFGVNHKQVKILRKRLAWSGYLKTSRGSSTFDKKLKVSLIKFQAEHGLNRSGIVSTKTRKALAVRLESRITQLEQSLERLRWMPNFLPERYVFVNTAGSELNLRDNNFTVLNMRTVVGQRRKDEDNNTETPSFNKKMKHIIVNPEWYVPRSIIKKELLPKIQKNIDFLARNNYAVYNQSGKVKIDPTSIDWKQFSPEDNIPYQIRQGIGDTNALGRIKFMFPNRHSIYLHDTPSKSLFSHETRSYSHGCVRLARPIDLASEIIQKSVADVKDIITTGAKTKIILNEELSVYIAYITAWARDDGTVVFYDDIYGFDERMKNNFI